MKLKGIVQREADASLTFHGTLHDNSTFEIRVSEHDVELNEPFKRNKNRVEGWLFIVQEAQQFDRVYITLPSPSLQHGHHVLVHELQLMPVNASIADFEAKKPVGETFSVKKPEVKKDAKVVKEALTVDEKIAKSVLESSKSCLGKTRSC